MLDTKDYRQCHRARGSCKREEPCWRRRRLRDFLDRIQGSDWCKSTYLGILDCPSAKQISKAQDGFEFLAFNTCNAMLVAGVLLFGA